MRAFYHGKGKIFEKTIRNHGKPVGKRVFGRIFPQLFPVVFTDIKIQFLNQVVEFYAFVTSSFEGIEAEHAIEMLIENIPNHPLVVVEQTVVYF